jgi:hypothetical protein
MLKEVNLLIELWDKVITTDAYLRNHTAVGPKVDN